MKLIRIVVAAISTFVLLILFQNCSSNGFESLSSTEALSSSSQTDVGNPAPSPSPTPTPSPSASPSPTVSPTVSPVAQLKKTQFYFAGGSTIASVELNHQTGVFTEKASTVFSGTDAAWLTYEKTSGTVFAVDAGSSVLQIYNHSNDTAVLSSRISLSSSPAQVHLTIAPTATGFNLFGASYNRGELSYYKINQTLNQVSQVQVVSQGATAKTHSSAFDASRGLLYVATLGLNKVIVYKFSEAAGLVELTSIPIEGARTVVYDSAYDKLFVSSEVYSGPSYLRVFSITNSGNSYAYTAVGSLAMPMAGGDLKLNRKFGFVMGTAREAGKESLWGLPITANGTADTTRSSFSIVISQALPRALEITDDGLYAVVGMNSAGSAGTLGFKMTFDAQRSFVSSAKVYQRASTNSSGYSGGVSIPVYGN
jgi:6-phosphogluconolactonase (cycloisomerase 2 family)